MNDRKRDEAKLNMNKIYLETKEECIISSWRRLKGPHLPLHIEKKQSRLSSKPHITKIPQKKRTRKRKGTDSQEVQDAKD